MSVVRRQLSVATSSFGTVDVADWRHVLYLISGKSARAFLYKSSHSDGQPKARFASGLRSLCAAPLMKWMNSPQVILRV